MTAAPQGRIDLGTLDTTPGAPCAFAPPAGVRLSPTEYLGLMRQRYGLRMPAEGKPRPIDHGARQQISRPFIHLLPIEVIHAIYTACALLFGRAGLCRVRVGAPRASDVYRIAHRGGLTVKLKRKTVRGRAPSCLRRVTPMPGFSDEEKRAGEMRRALEAKLADLALTRQLQADAFALGSRRAIVQGETQ